MSIATIIPAFNCAKTISRAVESILSQTHPVSEIIIVDDGSTDNTRSVIEKINSNTITYIYQKNQGAAIARNNGIASSKSEWITFLDADDYWLPKKIEHQINQLNTQPQLQWACCASFRENEGERNLTNSKSAESFIKESFKSTPGQLPYFQASYHKVFFQTSAFMIQKSVFEKIGVFDPRLVVCQDRDLWWRIAFQNPLISFVLTPLSVYKADTPSSLVKISPDRTQSAASVLENLERSKKFSEQTQQDFKRYATHLIRDYLKRCASREISINANIQNSLQQTATLRSSQRLWLKFLKCIPSKLAMKL